MRAQAIDPPIHASVCNPSYISTGSAPVLQDAAGPDPPPTPGDDPAADHPRTETNGSRAASQALDGFVS